MSLRDQILAADDLETRPVDVPEWGTKVWVRALSGKEREEYETSSMVWVGDRAKPNMKDFRTKLLVYALVNEDGTPIFTMADRDLLGAKSSSVIARLYDIAAEMSGIGEEAEAEIAGNFDAGQTGDSSSDSLSS